MNKTEITSQIKNTFNFMQKLFNESSYLVKEIEGQLSESEYRFQLLRTSGYAISSRSSNGLETNSVNFWLLRKFSVAFVEEIKTEIKGGQNVTEINNDLKVIYIRVVLDDKNENTPKIIFGVFSEIEKYKNDIKKFENLMGSFEYVENKLFAKFPNIDFKNAYFRVKGKFKKVDLLDIDSSDELIKKVINPVIKMYEES